VELAELSPSDFIAMYLQKQWLGVFCMRVSTVVRGVGLCRLPAEASEFSDD